MAKWEADVQNYLGFPEGIEGEDLLARGMQQVVRFEVTMIEDDIRSLNHRRRCILPPGNRHRLSCPACAPRHRPDSSTTGDSRREGMLGAESVFL